MKLYIVDAFADRLFTGNPAAVCPLDQWLPDNLMQQIAFENNLAETAFVVREDKGYRIRWFTPLVEVDLCGHATLATAHVLFNHEGYSDDTLSFNSRSGVLTVTKHNDQLSLDFPADEIVTIELSDDLLKCFSKTPVGAYKGKTDYMLVYEQQRDIENIIPNYEVISYLDARGVIITSPGKDADFVSRFFAPQCGINEDPVTGSAHTTLTPYWADRLNRSKLAALQLSQRGGRLECELANGRIIISGKAVTYLIGDIQLKNQ